MINPASFALFRENSSDERNKIRKIGESHETTNGKQVVGGSFHVNVENYKLYFTWPACDMFLFIFFIASVHKLYANSFY